MWGFIYNCYFSTWLFFIKRKYVYGRKNCMDFFRHCNHMCNCCRVYQSLSFGSGIDYLRGCFHYTWIIWHVLCVWKLERRVILPNWGRLQKEYQSESCESIAFAGNIRFVLGNWYLYFNRPRFGFPCADDWYCNCNRSGRYYTRSRRYFK